MKIINPGYEILTPVDRENILKTIEGAARVCYKSEDLITEDSASKMVRRLVKAGHHAMIEHAPVISVKFTVDRGVANEMVRHRVGTSFAQESTRYCSYNKNKFGNEITVIKPFFYQEGTENYNRWHESMLQAEAAYMALISNGSTPQEARSVLPNSLKTEIIITANMRAWRHFFELRTASAAHPQIREVAVPLLNDFKETLPELFDDIDAA